MRLRFLAAAGPPKALAALKQTVDRRAERALVKVFETSAMMVWTVSETPVVLAADGTAILIGLLFDRATGARLPSLSTAQDAKRIVEDRWGAYVLFTCEGSSHAVLRDPSGALPVYYGSLGELEVYASDAGLLEAAWPEVFRPDLEFIRHWLTFPFLRASRTGAEGVWELLPGTCRRVDPPHRSVVEAWSPFGFTDPASTINSFDEAAAALRGEILRIVPALAAANGEVAVQLSGGLDSSIIAAALRHAGTSFRAITFATLGPGGDERRFARAMAERCQAELVELMEETARLNLDIGRSNPLRPPPNPLLQPMHRAVTLQLAHRGTGTVLDGAGGDNIFCSLNTASPAIDAFKRAGSATALRALREVAQVHGSTFWTAARSALRRVRRGARSRWPRNTMFLDADAAATSQEPHPWLAPHPSLGPGKADQIRMVAGIHHFLPDPAPLTPASLHPLLAQPLLELCLRIPSWLWVAGGRDRAVAREAFRGMVPDAILDRRSKGTLESMFVKGYMAERPLLEQFIAEGELAQRGIIDGPAVSAYLRLDGQPRDFGYVRILEIAAAEQWLRSFDG
jgi:asparagine synthase (glutamine-hydrolysing)